mgnify:FL=1
MINYKVIYCLLHGGGRASKRQTNSFSPGFDFVLSLSSSWFPPSPERGREAAERSNTFSEANPAGGGVSGAKRLDCWRLAFNSWRFSG